MNHDLPVRERREIVFPGPDAKRASSGNRFCLAGLALLLASPSCALPVGTDVAVRRW